MKRILFFLLMLSTFVSACDTSQVDVDAQIATGMAQTLAALSTEPTTADTPTPTPDGYVVIPDVIGMKREDAYEILEDLGLVPLTYWVLHDDYVYGDVSDIEPEIGEFVPVDSEIVLNVVGQVVNIDSAGGTGDSGNVNPNCGFVMAICNNAYKDLCACLGKVYFCDPSTDPSTPRCITPWIP